MVRRLRRFRDFGPSIYGLKLRNLQSVPLGARWAISPSVIKKMFFVHININRNIYNCVYIIVLTIIAVFHLKYQITRHCGLVSAARICNFFKACVDADSAQMGHQLESLIRASFGTKPDRCGLNGFKHMRNSFDVETAIRGFRGYMHLTDMYDYIYS